MDNVQPAAQPAQHANLVTGVILAGGQGMRMGGVDKGWVDYQGKPLIEHALQRLAPQVEKLVIIANRSLEAYRQLGFPVHEDDIKGFHGPLAGLHAALGKIDTPLAFVVPVDAPHLPRDLLSQMLEKIAPGQTLEHPLLCNDGAHRQPLFGLYPRSLRPSLEAFLQSGQRKLLRWCDENHAGWIDFSQQAQAFTNMNSPDELKQDTVPAH